MESIDGIDRLLVSGTRATFTLKKGATFQEPAIQAALTKRKLSLDGFSMNRGRRPAAAFVLEVTGLG
jgi:hypothetical protein